jgi:eukaryotic-like serine/threonine-protein kinase
VGPQVHHDRSEDRPLVSGRVLGGYRLERFLGRGGYAYGLTAVRERDGAPVVVKMIRRPHRGDPEREADLLREGDLLRALAHPNVLPCLEGVRAEGWCFLVFPWLGGGMLRDLAARAPLQPARAVRACLDALAGLGHLHARGFVHRDVKPHNLHLGDDGVCRVADLGLAVERWARHRRGAGTEAYRAPEAARAVYDERTDIYGLGLTLHWLLTHRRPERDERGRPLLAPALPEPLGRWIRQAVDLDPDLRYESAQRAARALRAAAEQAELSLC